MKIKPMGNGVYICFDEGEQERIVITKEGNNIIVSHILVHVDAELTPEQLDECRIFNLDCEKIQSEIGMSGWHQDAKWEIGE